MKRSELSIAILIITAVFCVITFATATFTYKYMSEYFPAKKLDMYKVQKYSLENAKSLFDSLSEGGNGIKDLLADEEGLGDFLRYADWKNGDYDDKRTFGGGNYSTEATKDGLMEYGELYMLTVDGQDYMMYIQTRTSRYGRDNDGICFIGVTTWEHYDAIDWDWHPEDDEETVRVGSYFEREE